MKNTNGYVILKVVLPLILLVVIPLPIFLLQGLTITLEPIHVVFFRLVIEQLQNDVVYILLYFTILIVLFLILRKINKDKEFLSGDYYGDIPWLWYIIARLIGYGKISLRRKPYHIIYRLSTSNLFNIIFEDIDSEELNYELGTTTLNSTSSNYSEINLLVADTYDIKPSQIPKGKQHLKTIIINRKNKNGSRIYSLKLITEVGLQISYLKSQRAKINMFLTTNTKNTYEIFDRYVNIGGRDYVWIELFQQESNGERSFLNKGYIIKKGVK